MLSITRTVTQVVDAARAQVAEESRHPQRVRPSPSPASSRADCEVLLQAARRSCRSASPARSSAVLLRLRQRRRRPARATRRRSRPPDVHRLFTFIAMTSTDARSDNPRACSRARRPRLHDADDVADAVRCPRRRPSPVTCTAPTRHADRRPRRPTRTAGGTSTIAAGQRLTRRDVAPRPQRRRRRRAAAAGANAHAGQLAVDDRRRVRGRSASSRAIGLDRARDTRAHSHRTRRDRDAAAPAVDRQRRTAPAAPTCGRRIRHAPRARLVPSTRGRSDVDRPPAHAAAPRRSRDRVLDRLRAASPPPARRPSRAAAMSHRRQRSTSRRRDTSQRSCHRSITGQGC